MRERQVKIAVLVSGGGTNLQALINSEKKGILRSGRIALVISDREGAFALERANMANIPAVCIPKKKFSSKEAFEEELVRKLEDSGIELIILAGFLTVLSSAFTEKYDKRIINVHPSLIPSFCGDGFYGLKVHEAALARGVKITGATVHYVNNITDGGEIILQKAVKVKPDDTPEKLQRRVMKQAEWHILPLAAERVSRIIMNEYDE